MRVEPLLERRHNWPTIGLVVRQTFGGVELPEHAPPHRVEDLFERLDNHGTLLGKHLLQFAELAPSLAPQGSGLCKNGYAHRLPARSDPIR